jgi:hypothetical protein
VLSHAGRLLDELSSTYKCNASPNADGASYPSALCTKNWSMRGIYATLSWQVQWFAPRSAFDMFISESGSPDSVPTPLVPWDKQLSASWGIELR